MCTYVPLLLLGRCEVQKQFPGYYLPTNEEFGAMWRGGIFSVDANVLLNLYRYTKPTRERLLDILGRLKGQLWLTNQAGLEFHRNRQAVIAEQLNAYDAFAADLGENIDAALGKSKQQHARNFNLDIPALEAVFREASDKVAKLLQDAKGKHPDFLAADPILDQVAALFDARVGEPYTNAGLIAKYQEAQTRYDRQQPPGFKDAKKPIPDRYGDALVWFQLIDHAKQQHKPVIFITDDGKKDWWHIQAGKTVGPHPDLAYEWQSLAGVPFYMYSPQRFMEYAETFLRLSRQPDAIDEVQEVSDQVLRLTGEDLSRPIGTMGSGYLRYRTRLNVSAAMGLGVHDPAEITAFDWDAFWSWARQRGISDPETLEYLLPGQDVEQVPWVVRAILEGQSPEQYRWAEGRATYRIIQGLGYERTADLVLQRHLSCSSVPRRVRSRTTKLPLAGRSPVRTSKCRCSTRSRFRAANRRNVRRRLKGRNSKALGTA